jgi:hypothetical protein
MATKNFITTKLLDFVHRPDFYKPENTFRKQIQFPKRCVLWFVEIRTMDKVQKLSSNECYTPSSEPLRMYEEFISRQKYILLLGLFFSPEEGCNMFLQNIGGHSPTYVGYNSEYCTVLNYKIIKKRENLCRTQSF